MKNRRSVSLLCIGFIISFLCGPARAADMPRGIWVSVFSDRKVLYSSRAARELVRFCKESGINEIYLQVYQSGKAYYDTRLGDRAIYQAMLKSAGTDTIDILIKESHDAGMRVFAWVNVLSIGSNKKAHVLSTLHESALTLDQHSRGSYRSPQDSLDKYYLRENQMFLEPGDARVVEYIKGIVREISGRYPDLDGLHLDYIRYPYGLPFLPGSRFNQFGLTYGYSTSNMDAFTEKTGLDPLFLRNEKEYLAWDEWKRGRVTGLVKAIRKQLSIDRPSWRLSAAVLPVWDRAYNSAFQDWPAWVEQGIVDYVVLMSYTTDDSFFNYCLRAASVLRGKGRVYAGVGVFLMDSFPGQVVRQVKDSQKAGADGVIFFSYSGTAPATLMEALGRGED